MSRPAHLAAVPDTPPPPTGLPEQAADLAALAEALLGLCVEREVRDVAEPYGGVEAYSAGQIEVMRASVRAELLTRMGGGGEFVARLRRVERGEWGA